MNVSVFVFGLVWFGFVLFCFVLLVVVLLLFATGDLLPLSPLYLSIILYNKCNVME